MRSLSAAMLDQLLPYLTFVAVLGTGLIAGTFFAFSTFVMKALGRLAPSEGIAAMQSINVVIINPVFMGVFIGTAVVCLATSTGALLRWQKPGSSYLLGGSLCYLLGTFLVTIAFNVPLNDSLANLKTTDPDSTRQWEDYASRWTAWNHVRTAAAVAAAGSFALALRR